MPLDEDLSEENRTLSEALRALFSGLKISVRRYAARRHRDAGTVSRYLNGKRIPPWEFVLDLMHDVAEGHGGPTVETLEHLRALHRSALQASGSPQHAIQLLQDQLADSDRRARQWATTEESLQQTLQDRQHRIADLEVQMRQLQSAQEHDVAEAAGIVAWHEENAESLRAERDRLRVEVENLTEELSRARAQSVHYEEKCQELERQLESIEENSDDAMLHAEQDERAVAAERLVEEERQRTAQATQRADELAERLRAAEARLIDQENRKAEEPMAGSGKPQASVALVRGGSVSLTREEPNLTTVLVTVGWNLRTSLGSDFDLDACALVVGSDGVVISDAHFVFYNNLKNPDGSVEHTNNDQLGKGQGEEILVVDLARIPEQASKIVFPVSIYDAQNRRQTFAQLSNTFIRVVNQANGNELTRYDFTEDASTEYAMVAGELYRYSGEWRFRAVGQGYASGLRGIGLDFGVNV